MALDRAPKLIASWPLYCDPGSIGISVYSGTPPRLRAPHAAIEFDAHAVDRAPTFARALAMIEGTGIADASVTIKRRFRCWTGNDLMNAYAGMIDGLRMYVQDVRNRPSVEHVTSLAIGTGSLTVAPCYQAVMQASLRTFALDATTLVGDRLLAGVSELNGGAKPRIITMTMSNMIEIMRIRALLDGIPDDEYAIVCLAKDLDDSTSYSVTVDKIGRLRGRIFNIQRFAGALLDYKFWFHFSALHAHQAIHLYSVSAGGDGEDVAAHRALHGRGVVSETFGRFAALLEKHFQGWIVTTAAIEHSYKTDGRFLIIPHLMRKHFDVDGYGPLTDRKRVDQIWQYAHVDPIDFKHIYEGRVRSKKQ